MQCSFKSDYCGILFLVGIHFKWNVCSNHWNFQEIQYIIILILLRAEGHDITKDMFAGEWLLLKLTGEWKANDDDPNWVLNASQLQQTNQQSFGLMNDIIF